MPPGRAASEWPDRRPNTATRKPFKQEVVKRTPWSYYEDWDHMRPDMYTAVARSDYRRYAPQPQPSRPEFSVSAATDVGLGTVSQKIGLEELRAKPVPYSRSHGPDPERLRTTSSLAFSAPDVLRARLEPRAGVLVEMDLPPGYSRTSAGLLPGKTTRGARFAPESTTHRSDMRAHMPQPPRAVPSFTLSWGASGAHPGYSIQVPPNELGKTHFELGREPLDYATATRAAHTEQARGTGQQALKAFGVAAESGDRGTDYHILHGGAPFKPSRYYEPALPAQIRHSFRPVDVPTAPQRYNTITGELQRCHAHKGYCAPLFKRRTSAMGDTSARVTIAQLPQFVGKAVRVVGNVKAINGNTLTLSDELGAEVHIACKGLPRFREGVVEAIGVVQANGADVVLDEMTSTQFGAGFNLELYREAVAQLQRFPQLYPVC